MNEKVGVLKRLADYRKDLAKTLNTKSSVFHKVNSKYNWNCSYDSSYSKGVEADTVEIFSINKNYSIGFSYTNLNSENINDVYISVSLKNTTKDKFVFTNVFKYDNIKPFFKSFTEAIFLDLKNVKYVSELKVEDIYKKTFGEYVNNEVNTLADELNSNFETIYNSYDYKTVAENYDIKKASLKSSEKFLQSKKSRIFKKLGIAELEKLLKDKKDELEKSLEKEFASVSALKNEVSKIKRETFLKVSKIETSLTSEKNRFPISVQHKSEITKYLKYLNDFKFKTLK